MDLKRKKVIIVDDALIYREGIESLLELEDSIKVIGSVDCGEKLFELLKQVTPDIILLDIEMPDMKGDEILELLNRDYNTIKVIMVSFYFEVEILEYYESLGAYGFIPKDADSPVFLSTIEQVAQGKKCFNLEEIKRLLQRRKARIKVRDATLGLTKREIEIIALACKGKMNKEIANILCLTERTVEFHKTNIYKKTGSNSTASLMLYAIQKGILDVKQSN